MSGPRLAVSASGADAAEIARLAPLSEDHNIDTLVVGALHVGAQPGIANSDHTYVVTAAAAAVTRTKYLRVAVVLDLRGSATPLQVAEDLGVLDVLSNGRLELILRPGPEPSWSRDLGAVLGAWTGWPLPAAADRSDLGPGRVRSTPVTPAPVQPEIPVWLLEPADPPIARPLSRGAAIVFFRWPRPSSTRDTAIPDTAIPDTAAVHEMRRVRDEAGAGTVAIDVGATPPEQRTEVIRTLATVVGPCLRCAEEEVEILALDTSEWLRHRTELHRPPLEDPSRQVRH